MLLTGPYTLAGNVPLTLEDPSPSSGSVAVQLQNGSSYSLTCYALGRTFDIGANTAATIPASNGTPMTVVPGASGTSSNGLTALWLYPGEFNPQHDGAIPSVTQQGGVVSYPNLPPPPTTGGFQTFTDSAGDIWVAQPGVNAGAWGRSTNVLHARWARANPWNTAAVTTLFNMDTLIRDPYGLYASATGLTSPIPGLWQVYWQLAVTPTAVGQFVSAFVRLNGTVNAQQSTNAAATVATYVSNTVVIRCAAGDVLSLAQQGSVAGLAGLTGANITYVDFDYLGTG